jgi:hypothetical protein
MVNDGEKYFGKATVFNIVPHSKVNEVQMSPAKLRKTNEKQYFWAGQTEIQSTA